ncbi:MAG: DUF2846 domain-containing protein [Stellaceae bacterium]
MRSIHAFLMAAITVSLAACAAPNATPYPAAAPPAPTPAAMLSGPANPRMARIYFYRNPAYRHLAWRAVWLNGAKVGDLPPGSYFYRDVAPGTYRVTVTSDAPYGAQHQTATVPPGSTNFVEIYRAPGYGISGTVTTTAGRRAFQPSNAQIPSVYGGSFVPPVEGERAIAKLHPEG